MMTGQDVGQDEENVDGYHLLMCRRKTSNLSISL